MAEFLERIKGPALLLLFLCTAQLPVNDFHASPRAGRAQDIEDFMLFPSEHAGDAQSIPADRDRVFGRFSRQ
jgi:hypothetical protein